MVLLLIIVNAAIFLLEAGMSGETLQRVFGLIGVVPLRAKVALAGDSAHAAVYGVSLFTSMFLHGGWLHLIGNMWYLWIFGGNIEDRLGAGGFLVFYLLCGVLAAAAHTAANLDSQIPTVGASGAIAGVLGAYLVLFPRARILTLVPIFFLITFIRLPAILVLGAWFFVQLLNQTLELAAARDIQSVAWMAHIGGFVAGMLLIALFPKRRGYRPRSRV